MTTSRPLISILTPVFNQSSYIEQTIKSVLNQTYQDWEWIIVDDGSTDGRGDIINGMKNGRIQYIFQEHAGVNHLTASRNKALRACNGDLIAMLDGDDYWPDYKLEKQVKNFALPDVVLSYGECMIVNRNGRIITYRSLPSDQHIANNDPVGSALKLFMLKRNCFITNSTVMLKKKALLDIGGFIEARDVFHDFTTWTRLALEGRFVGNPLCLGYWRRHLSSTDYKSDPEVLMKSGLDFLREFVVLHRQKLADLGFSYDRDVLEELWNKLNPYEHCFNRAMIDLSYHSFREARSAYK
jgi:glycosyltransferase involved in cell wall biosynthesis